eukprot:scaffold181496_cov17-Tisochrysis_lutea.AAC.2
MPKAYALPDWHPCIVSLQLRFAGKSPELSRLELSGCCLPGLKPDVFASLSGASHLRVLHLRRSSLGKCMVRHS